ncbi:uncharacterized protein LOC111015701 [Momordica charantia]|uniref:Uncharacterized protein LOC111015701 n=1 Tax=Momordica charantia TaxID=3673 RepID=A0A6J1CZJ5_MOMCH|nr:uncharacterized protein LOC111015701 [Momordica charantia]
MPHFSLDDARDFLLIMRNFLKSFKIQTKYGTSAAAAASSVIISGIGLVLIYVYTQRKREKNDRRVFMRSMSIGALHGGKLAMKRLLQYQKMRATEKNQDQVLEKLEKMIKDCAPDFAKLQSIVAKLEMRGQEDKAIEILKKAAKEAKENSLLHYEYEYQILLVEMLIYKGNIGEAERASCLNQEETSDVRRSLYKAIIQVLLNNPKKAKEKWEEFKEMRSRFLLPPDVKDSQFYKLVTEFEMFKQVVDLLGKDIEERNKEKN